MTWKYSIFISIFKREFIRYNGIKSQEGKGKTMKLTKKANYLLMFLVVLNATFRFPTTPHELGVDSFKMHGMANFISANGYVKWIMHLLSLFGLYPKSQKG